MIRALARRRQAPDARLWRKPGKLRPSHDVGVFPRMSAKQGAQRGQSEADPPLLPRNCRSSASSAARTSRSTIWRDALMATSASLAISAERPAISERKCATLAGAGPVSVPARERNQGSWPQRSRRRTARTRGWPRCWRNPGKLRPSCDVGVSPRMSALRGRPVVPRPPCKLMNACLCPASSRGGSPRSAGLRPSLAETGRETKAGRSRRTTTPCSESSKTRRATCSPSVV